MSYTNDPAVSKTLQRIPLDAVRLRQARQSKQLTLEEVSAAVFINKMTLLRYETGDIRAIAPERLARLAALYDITPAYLCGISLDQEFTTNLGLQIIPVHADPPTQLGRRLTSCLSLAKQLSSERHLDDPIVFLFAEPGAGSCASAIATAINPQPIHSLPDSPCPKINQPANTENTDSKLSTSDATVGSTPFCPTTCKV